MRILVPNLPNPNLLASSYVRAFEALGHEVVQINPMVTLERDPLLRNRITRRLLERWRLERNVPALLKQLLAHDVDMIWVSKGQWSVPALWRAYKAARPETVLVCYNSDDPVTTYSRGCNAPWVTEAIGSYDLFGTFKPDILQALKDHGAPEVYLQLFAWDPDILPRAETTTLDHDLLFLANGDDFRQQWLIDILSDPRTQDWKIGIYGYWPRSGHARLDALTQPMPYQQDQIPQTIANAVVSLNILRQQNISNHNLRSFEIPGAGGLCLSQYTDQIGAVFPRDEAALYFDTPEDAVTQVLRVKQDPTLRHKMVARAGHIVRDHTFKARADALLKRVSQLNQNDLGLILGSSS
jgi:spore maturation protein CgeB